MMLGGLGHLGLVYIQWCISESKNQVIHHQQNVRWDLKKYKNAQKNCDVV